MCLFSYVQSRKKTFINDIAKIGNHFWYNSFPAKSEIGVTMNRYLIRVLSEYKTCLISEFEMKRRF